MEVEDEATGYDLVKPIENIAFVVVGKRWDRMMYPDFIRDIFVGTTHYNFDCVQDLLWLRRNKLNHYRELSLVVQLFFLNYHF